MHFSSVPLVGIIGHILVLFSTLAHEMGHGLTAMLLGGDFQTLTIQWNAAGQAESMIADSRIVKALVAAGGLVGPAIAAAILFSAARGTDRQFTILTRLFGGALFLLGLMTARSVWALIFTVGLGMALVVLPNKVKRNQLETLVVFIGVQLGLSVFTRSDYLFTRWAGPGKPSDVAQMAEALFLPFWFWGALCGIFSVVVLLWGCHSYIKK